MGPWFCSCTESPQHKFESQPLLKSQDHGRNSAGFFCSTWCRRRGAWRGRRFRRQICLILVFHCVVKSRTALLIPGSWIKGKRIRWNLGHLVLNELLGNFDRPRLHLSPHE